MKCVLRDLRKRSGLSQADVASALGVLQTTVSMWETGENMPRTALLPKLAELYGCTIDDLFEKEETA